MGCAAATTQNSYTITPANQKINSKVSQIQTLSKQSEYNRKMHHQLEIEDEHTTPTKSENIQIAINEGMLQPNSHPSIRHFANNNYLNRNVFKLKKQTFATIHELSHQSLSSHMIQQGAQKIRKYSNYQQNYQDFVQQILQYKVESVDINFEPFQKEETPPQFFLIFPRLQILKKTTHY